MLTVLDSPAENSVITANDEPARGRPWPKGISGNPGGRPKSQNGLRELTRSYAEEALNTLVDIMRNGSERAQIVAAMTILDRGYGKPTQDFKVVEQEHQSVAWDTSMLTDIEQAELSRILYKFTNGNREVLGLPNLKT